MNRTQYTALMAIAATLITLCRVEVMRGEDLRAANKEALTRDLMNLALRAQDYYHRPYSRGGGQGSFQWLTANYAGLSRLTSTSFTPSGLFGILYSGTATSVVLIAYGTQLGTDGNLLRIEITVFADSTSITFH